MMGIVSAIVSIYDTIILYKKLYEEHKNDKVDDNVLAFMGLFGLKTFIPLMTLILILIFYLSSYIFKNSRFADVKDSLDYILSIALAFYYINVRFVFFVRDKGMPKLYKLLSKRYKSIM